MEGCITMTHKELDRFKVIKEAHEKRIKMIQAAEILGLSKRQTQRLSKRPKMGFFRQMSTWICRMNHYEWSYCRFYRNTEL